MKPLIPLANCIHLFLRKHIHFLSSTSIISGYIKYLMTENTDGMLIKAGADEDSVIEINGKFWSGPKRSEYC